MELYERLYDESERANVQFVGMTTEHSRYDFAILYTNLFFGKPLVTCMQSGRSCLLNREDLEDADHVRHTFRVHYDKDVEALREFFWTVLPPPSLETQY